MTSPVSSATRFWDFSLRVYPAPGVKEACLALQAEGADVNIGLWIGWLSAQGRDPLAGLGQAVAVSALWSSRVVTPLRTARNALKPAPEFIAAEAAARLRRSLLQAELEAERLEQEALAPLGSLCPVSPDPMKTLFHSAMIDYAARLERVLRPDRFIESVSAAAKKGV